MEIPKCDYKQISNINFSPSENYDLFQDISQIQEVFLENNEITNDLVQKVREARVHAQILKNENSYNNIANSGIISILFQLMNFGVPDNILEDICMLLNCMSNRSKDCLNYIANNYQPSLIILIITSKKNYVILNSTLELLDSILNIVSPTWIVENNLYSFFCSSLIPFVQNPQLIYDQNLQNLLNSFSKVVMKLYKRANSLFDQSAYEISFKILNYMKESDNFYLITHLYGSEFLYNISSTILNFKTQPYCRVPDNIFIPVLTGYINTSTFLDTRLTSSLEYLTKILVIFSLTDSNSPYFHILDMLLTPEVISRLFGLCESNLKIISPFLLTVNNYLVEKKAPFASMIINSPHISEMLQVITSEDCHISSSIRFDALFLLWSLIAYGEPFEYQKIILNPCIFQNMLDVFDTDDTDLIQKIVTYAVRPLLQFIQQRRNMNDCLPILNSYEESIRNILSDLGMLPILELES